MKNPILRNALFVALVLMAVLASGRIFDWGIGPVPALMMAIFVPCLLFALVKFPAAFLVPVLFVPQDKPLPLIPLRFQGDVTTLALAIALLVVAMLVRAAVLSARGTPPLGDLLQAQRKGIALYLVFGAVVTFSYIYTQAPDYGADKLIRFLTIGSLCFLAPFILFREEHDFRDFALTAVVLALATGASRFASTSRGSFGKYEEVTHIGIGQLIGMAILLVLHFRFLKGPRTRYLGLLCLFPLGVGLIASEARGPLLSLIFVLALFSLLDHGTAKPLLSYRVLTMGAVAAVLLFALVIPPSWIQGEAAEMLRFKKNELVNLAEGADSKGSGGRRLDFYRGAIAAIEAKPALGWGVGGWSSYYFRTDDRHYPHNLLLEVGVEEGLVGIAVLLVYLLTVFKAAREVFREGGERFAFLLPILIYSFCVTMTSGDIDDNRFLWFWCGTALAVLALIKDGAEDMAPGLAEVFSA